MLFIDNKYYSGFVNNPALKICINDNIKSFKLISYDDDNDVYLSNSCSKAIYFENVIKFYRKKDIESNLSSCDGLYFNSLQLSYFIEFKNGNIFYYNKVNPLFNVDEENSNNLGIKKKFYDSINFLKKYCNHDESFCINNYNLILVYNYAKLPEYYKRVLWQSKNSNVLINNIGLNNFVEIGYNTKVMSSYEFDDYIETV